MPLLGVILSDTPVVMRKIETVPGNRQPFLLRIDIHINGNIALFEKTTR